MAAHIPPPVQFLDIAAGRRIAYRHVRGVRPPTLLYVPGHLSTMEIHKAVAVEQYAAENGYSSIRYDKEGVGRSTPADTKDVVISDWVEDILSIVDRVIPTGEPIVIVASSMGGWLSTYVASVRPERIRAMVFIGPGFYFPNQQMEDLVDSEIFDKEAIGAFLRGDVSWSWESKYGMVHFSKRKADDSVQFELDWSKPIKVATQY